MSATKAMADGVLQARKQTAVLLRMAEADACAVGVKSLGGLLIHLGLIVISSVIFTSSWLAFTCKDWEVNFTNGRDTSISLS